MARGITEQDVFTTADDLLAQGQRPTIERIRVALGRGSPNTVNRHLDAWWAALSQRITAHKTESGLPSAVQGFANKLWESALNQARAKTGQDNELVTQRQLEHDKHLQEQREALDRDRAAVEKALPMLKDELLAVRAQLEARDRRISELETDLKRLSADMRRAEVELGRRQAELDKAQTRAVGNEKHLMEKLSGLRVALDESRRKARLEAGQLRKQLDTAQNQLTASIRNSTGLNSAKTSAKRSSKRKLPSTAKRN